MCPETEDPGSFMVFEMVDNLNTWRKAVSSDFVALTRS